MMRAPRNHGGDRAIELVKLLLDWVRSDAMNSSPTGSGDHRHSQEPLPNASTLPPTRDPAHASAPPDSTLAASPTLAPSPAVAPNAAGKWRTRRFAIGGILAAGAVVIAVPVVLIAAWGGTPSCGCSLPPRLGAIGNVPDKWLSTVTTGDVTTVWHLLTSQAQAHYHNEAGLRVALPILAAPSRSSPSGGAATWRHAR
jgi:hypothetical protein